MQNKKQNLLYGISAIIIGAIVLIFGIYMFSGDITQDVTGYMCTGCVNKFDSLFENWGIGSVLFILPMVMLLISAALVILGTLKLFGTLKNPLVIKILAIILAVLAIFDLIWGILVCNKFGAEITEIFDFGFCIFLPLTILGAVWTLICHKIVK